MAQRDGRGLYDPAFEHDSCGFGLIASVDNQPSRWVVETALSSLDRLSHRGAVAADGMSGDGCGVLLHRPEAFLRAAAAEAGLKPGAVFAAGNVFLPDDDAAETECRSVLEEEIRRMHLGFAGWRALPIDRSACGATALAGLPRIAQVFVAPAPRMKPAAFARALFVARRRAERRLVAHGDFYVVTLSPFTLGYKAMVLPGLMTRLYPDLARPDLTSSAVLFHQRYSTNTSPRWRLAHPYRMLAHNGEINTIQGNRNWALARRGRWSSPHLDLSELDPPVSMDGSDSQSLDEMVELLLAGGMDSLQALRVLIPPASAALEYADPDLAAFYEYYALHSEPWDGPAGIVFCDGRYAGCTLDRNGLRPARWMLTEDRHLTIASETGVWDCPTAQVVARGRLGPGEMLAVDLVRHTLLDTAAIDAINRARAPYKRWLKQGVRYLVSDLIDPALAAEPFDPATLARFQKLFGLSREEREQILRPLAETESEATGSMGDDTPMPVLSQQVRSLYDSFRQGFAQVTNPPIDPLREQVVMSLATQIGREGNIFELSPCNARQVLLNSPVMSQRKLRQLLALDGFAQAHARVELLQLPGEDLESALRRICAEAEAAVRAGAVILLLSDRYPQADRLPVHALLATGAVHQHLVRAGLRVDCNLVVETGTARDPHHFACLIGFGATAVYPYLAYQTLFDFGRSGLIRGRNGGEGQTQIGRSYRRGIRKGLLKIISKLGIATIAGYRGAQLFEIVGLAPGVVELCFAGTPCRIAGAGFAELEADSRALAARAWDEGVPLAAGGLLKWAHDGEYHMVNPDVVALLQRAVRSGREQDYREYARCVDERPPSTLRDLLALRALGPPVPLDEVEPAESILPRFDSAGMSLGALSPEAHEALAIAMNRLGSRSNSGEGGEDESRYGTERSSKIKQVASGRFGVTPHYLASAEVLQIKIAQGAKPGEGGQLPGHKVNELIARLRYARPGIGLISPPPHHDIYSIEDLAQLVYDLKQVNPRALVSVKLVSHAGVGTIAAGVVKAYADLITISGYDGGTGASPQSSIKYAGTPWELGLAEAQQTLMRNGLRHKVRLQVDGGLKTGLDVIKAALLGAESFGFGTAPMVALGCKYLRICHLNNCATGIATQDPRLREAHFTGLPELVMRYFRFVVEDVRAHMARLGVRRFEDLVGNTSMLSISRGGSARQRGLDLAPLLLDGGTAGAAKSCTEARNPPRDPGELAARMLADMGLAIAAGRGHELHYPISNRDRSIGARVSGEIALRHGNHGMAAHPITARFTGSAGQSFGAWNAGGLHLYLEGDANDGVAKGMTGGKVVLRPPRDARYVARDTPIMGNTCLYGATGGELYAAGRAGERFAVRNSGATAVVEGVGDHGCEYMTDGVVAVLGPTGINFGAGFTGGIAYVLDTDRDFVDRYNHELIDILRISPEGMENHLQHLRGLIADHVRETGSEWGRTLLEEFRDYLGKFWLVKPKAASLESLVDALRRAA